MPLIMSSAPTLPNIRWDFVALHSSKHPLALPPQENTPVNAPAKMSSQASGAGPSFGRVSTACARCRRQKLKVGAPSARLGWNPLTALSMVQHVSDGRG